MSAAWVSCRVRLPTSRSRRVAVCGPCSRKTTASRPIRPDTARNTSMEIRVTVIMEVASQRGGKFPDLPAQFGKLGNLPPRGLITKQHALLEQVARQLDAG